MFSQTVVYYFYGVWQKKFDTNKYCNLEFIKDLPDKDFLDMIKHDKHALLLL